VAEAGVGVLMNATRAGGVGSGSIFVSNVEEAAAVPGRAQGK
jgi:nitrogen regulatory protein PII